MNTRILSIRPLYRLLAMAAAAMVAAPAHADSVIVNLAGFQSGGTFGSAANSQSFVSIEPGSTVTGWDFQNLSFTTSGESFLNEFVLSVSAESGLNQRCIRASHCLNLLPGRAMHARHTAD